MNAIQTEMIARRDDWSVGISLFMRQFDGADCNNIATGVTMKQWRCGDKVEPMLRLNITEAQQLMDELWFCGLRPTEGGVIVKEATHA